VPVQFIAVTGLAGAGKTALLARLAAAGEQVLDLEAQAAHRGSSFGRIGIDRSLPTRPAGVGRGRGSAHRPAVAAA
jgi:tRNA 2-selenouridine synthase SelU